MNQCVPSWDLDDNPTSPRLNIRAQSTSNSLPVDVPTLDYEVAELTWENGQLAMHGLGLPRLPTKHAPPSSPPPPKYTWEKPGGADTLESLVNQATYFPHHKAAVDGCSNGGEELVAWFAVPPSASGSVTVTMDALVPCTNSTTKSGPGPPSHVPVLGKRVGGCSTHVGSCSDARDTKYALAGIGAAHEWSTSRAEHSVSYSATCGTDSRQMTLDTLETELGTVGFTSTSMGSPENTSSAKPHAKSPDDHDSVCHSISQVDRRDDNKDKKKGSGKSSVSTKRSRAAAIHNQSERKRRDKINQKMKTLQKLIPNSCKTDKASMLDEVIEYLKQLQAQIQMMGRMNMPQIMLPVAMQQHLQMYLMTQMGMGMAGMGMGMGMDINSMGRSGIPPVLHPGAFMPPHMLSWDGTGDRLPTPNSAGLPDPFSAFLAAQSQPMTMDAYTRMANLYQQFQQPPGPTSKN